VVAPLPIKPASKTDPSKEPTAEYEYYDEEEAEENPP
jgi:hypothetical protein